jgi:hypothetical protein
MNILRIHVYVAGGFVVFFLALWVFGFKEYIKYFLGFYFVAEFFIYVINNNEY